MVVSQKQISEVAASVSEWMQWARASTLAYVDGVLKYVLAETSIATAAYAPKL
jgi:hypothetical protein